MQRIILWGITIIGAGLIGLILWNATRAPESPSVVQPAPRAEAPPPPQVPAEPEIRHPVPDKIPEKPLPALDTSDSTMQGAIAGLSADQGLGGALILQGFVRRVVATIDNLPRSKVATRLLPLKRVDGTFAVSGSEGSFAIAPANAARYAAYLKLMDAVATDKLAAFYFHYYPLFQQAYRELGYPKGHFNDRLVEVIDHLLEAPDLKPPVALLRPKVLYLYADPELEARSAGQKILMRMGAENAARIKSKLREIRAAIAQRPGASGRKN
ncbi:MAG: DUF3014 domain-containing protein [Burkholderiales bacterium]